MRTEAEAREAYQLLKDYLDGGALLRISAETANNLVGMQATLEWLLGEEGCNYPTVACCVRDWRNDKAANPRKWAKAKGVSNGK